jgi:hypothetical protein
LLAISSLKLFPLVSNFLSSGQVPSGFSSHRAPVPLRVPENQVLRRICGPKREEVAIG